MDYTVDKLKAAEVQGRLNAYADTNESLGFYTESKCGFDAVNTISRLLEIIAALEEKVTEPKAKTDTNKYVSTKNFCGHCGKSFASMIPGTRCRTPYCEAGKYWCSNPTDA